MENAIADIVTFHSLNCLSPPPPKVVGGQNGSEEKDQAEEGQRRMGRQEGPRPLHEHQPRGRRQVLPLHQQPGQDFLLPLHQQPGQDLIPFRRQQIVGQRTRHHVMSASMFHSFMEGTDQFAGNSFLPNKLMSDIWGIAFGGPKWLQMRLRKRGDCSFNLLATRDVGISIMIPSPWRLLVMHVLLEYLQSKWAFREATSDNF